MRTLALGILAGVGLAIGALPAAADSRTTRIEPRPFYGATVTLEEGVRVFRPLPRHDRIIINPNKTPLYLGFNETYSYSYGSNQVYNHSANGGGAYPAGVWGLSGKPHARARSHGHAVRGVGSGSRR